MSSDTPQSDDVKSSDPATPQDSNEPQPAMTTAEATSAQDDAVAPAAGEVAEPSPSPVEAAASPPDTAPLETAPAQSAPVETAPVETAPVETAPVETVAAEAVVAESATASATAEPTSEPVAATSATAPPAAPATEPPATEPPATEDSASTEKTTGARTRLNPIADDSMVKAVPSVDPATATPAAETPAVPPDAAEEEAPVEAEVAPAAEPVELPARDVDLGADLEAEIEAAIKADESASEAAIEVQQADDEAESADEDEEVGLFPGGKLRAKVQSLHSDNVFFDIGGRSPGVVSARQFLTDKPPAVGDEFDVVVERIDEAEGLVVLNLPRGRRSIGGNWDAVAKGQVVDCMVTKTNKGGLEVTVSSLRGFMPASQIDLSFVGDMEVYVGQKLQAVITEANPKKRNLVVSRRAFLDIARKEAAEELWKTLAEGQTHTGHVKTIKPYGAFVDIGGVDGFLHIGEISWTRLNHPSDVLSEGQEVEVQVIKIEREKTRISLGMKQLKSDPWTLVTANYPVASTVSGQVTRTMDFGAFVELEAGVEGLVHISELDYSRVNKVTDVLNVGQQVDLKVLEVDPSRRRIGLSLKQLKEKPPEMQKSSADAVDEEDAPPPIERKRKEPLRGGTGPETAGGGLFGNPSDFS